MYSQVLAQALSEIFKADARTEIIGVRHGEAMYETLLTKEEAVMAVDMGNFYRIPLDQREMNYEKYCEIIEDETLIPISEFTSNNTMQLNVEQTKEKLSALDYIKREFENWRNIAKYGISYLRV